MGSILDELAEMSAEEQKKFREQTKFNVNIQPLEETLEHGTVKITDELAKQAKDALTSRIEATADYTKQRIERINLNYKLYNQKHFEDDALSKVFFPVTFNACEDWIDDLTLIFSKTGDTIELDCPGDVLGEFITKKLDASEVEQKNKAWGVVFSFAKWLLKRGNIKTENIYYFQKKEAVKEFLRLCLRMSDFEKNLEEYITHGVVGGQFCFKEVWDNCEDYQIEVGGDSEGSPDGRQYISQGKFKYTVKKEYAYKFKPVDTRNLIFRKDCIDWVIEKVDGVQFSSLLARTLDENNEPKKNAIFDFEQLKKVKEYLKKEKVKAEPETDEPKKESGFEADDVDQDDIYDIDGNINIYEAHWIPLIMSTKEGGKRKPTLCLVAYARCGEDNIPIRIQPYPFYKLSYKFTPFMLKTGDVAGMGLPELVEKIQNTLNEFQNFSIDMIDMAIWGILFFDPDHIEDPTKCNSLSPREGIQLKDMKGMAVDQVVQWLRPPTDALNAMQNIFGLQLQMLNKTTRKGPGGEKIAPNPSATEATSILREMQKSVNRVGLRLSMTLETMIENMYIYTIMNRNSYLNLKIQGYSVKGKEELENMALNPEALKEGVNSIAKEVRLTPEELLVNGLDFTIKALDLEPEKQAIEKQQAMQVLDILFNKVGLTQPEETIGPNGQPVKKMVPKTYVDDTGTEVEIDQWKVLNDFLSRSGFQDVWKRTEPKQLPAAGVVPPAPTAAGGINAPQAAPSAPLNQSVKPGVIQAQAVQPR